MKPCIKSTLWIHGYREQRRDVGLFYYENEGVNATNSVTHETRDER